MTDIAFALRAHIKTLRLSGRNDGMVEDMEKAATELEAYAAGVNQRLDKLKREIDIAQMEHAFRFANKE